MRLLVAGPPCDGLAAALDALHGGAEGPVEMLALGGGGLHGWPDVVLWADAAGIEWMPAVPALTIADHWPTLVLTTPGDTSGAAAMAREAGVEVREVGT